MAGTEIHEPKGVAAASLGQVYVADGNGSGNWSNIGTSSFTGMISDFTWPVVQDGWLECDGSDINITTYGTLFAVMTIQMDGTRTSGSAVITSLSSTTNMRVGYYIYGVGIAEDTTILTVDSSSQVTMSANASSTGTATVIVSPWRLGNGVIRLPNLSAAGRFRRSRSSNTVVGELQASTNIAHTHVVAATTGNESGDHTHTVSGNTGIENSSLAHTHGYISPSTITNLVDGGANYSNYAGTGAVTASGGPANHTHSFSVISSGRSSVHTHSFSTTSASSGDTESKPNSIVVMTCVKT